MTERMTGETAHSGPTPQNKTGQTQKPFGLTHHCRTGIKSALTLSIFHHSTPLFTNVRTFNLNVLTFNLQNQRARPHGRPLPLALRHITSESPICRRNILESNSGSKNGAGRPACSISKGKIDTESQSLALPKMPMIY